MALNVLPPRADGFRLHPVGSQHAAMFVFGLLTVSCALASFALACATPFAAFAVVAAALLPLRPALLVVIGAWLVNQMIGFGALHHPVDANTVASGFSLGAAALAATAASSVALRTLPAHRAPLVLAMTFLLAYAVYEIVLFAATPFVGGEDAFNAAIVAQLGGLNVVWLVGLAATCEIVRLLNPFRRDRALSA